MQKKVYKISIICLSLFAILLVIRVINLIQNKNELIENIYSNDYVVNKKDNLTMMLETDYDSNQYELATSSEWPTDGYIFNEKLSACKNGSQVSWDSETNRVVVYAGSIDSCYIYFDKEPDIIYLADYIKNVVYTGVDGENDVYYHDGVGSYSNVSEEAEDNSYRYSGANPNNYVCFGSDAATCPNDNLYRIIGVFGNQVKLIKHDYANSNMLGTDGAYFRNYESIDSYYKGSHSSVNSYVWNSATGTNIWSESNLNTVNFNTNYINYLNGINSKWVNMIEDTTWIIGGNILENIVSTTVKNTYVNEIVSPTANTTYSAKIGLMYASDYGYAASPENWTTNLDSYDNDTNRNNNWMYMGLYEWTITRRSDVLGYAVIVYNIGSVHDNYGYNTTYYGVRPVFYLKPNVAITSGDGSSSSPYRIALD